MWIDPLFDRTLKDVEGYFEVTKTIRGKQLEEVTEEEWADYEKFVKRGIFTDETLNRIEGNSDFLWDLLYQLGYIARKLEIKTWTYKSFDIGAPTRELQRIKDNVKKMQDTYAFKYTDLPESMTNLYDHFNAVEKVLWDLKDLCARIVGSYQPLNMAQTVTTPPTSVYMPQAYEGTMAGDYF